MVKNSKNGFIEILSCSRTVFLDMVKTRLKKKLKHLNDQMITHVTQRKNAISIAPQSLIICLLSVGSISSYADQMLVNQFNLDHALIDIKASELTAISDRAINVFVARPKITFSEKWIRKFKKDTSKNYRKKILSKYRHALNKELIRVIAHSRNFDIVDAKSSADIIFKPALSDIFIYAPDDQIKKHYVLQSGVADFSMKVTSNKGDVLAEYKDREKTRRTAKMSTLESNLNDFTLLMSNWSQQTVTHLSYSINDPTYLASQPN